MPRVLARAGRRDRTARSRPIHDRIREGRARAKDPGRLSQEQSDQYVGRRILDSCARRRAGVDAASVGGSDGVTQTWNLDGADRGAPVVVATSRPVAGVLDDEAAPASACRSGAGANPSLAVTRPALPPMGTRAVPAL